MCYSLFYLFSPVRASSLPLCIIRSVSIVHANESRDSWQTVRNLPNVGICGYKKALSVLYCEYSFDFGRGQDWG